MRSPRKPPSIDIARLARITSLRNTTEFVEYIRKANSEYYHWDDLRYRTPPLGLNPEDGWTAVKLSRSNRRHLSLIDGQGVPFSYWLPDQANQILHVVDCQSGGVLAVPPGAPTSWQQVKDRILIDSLMEEAIATSRIEGAVTTRKVAKELLRSGRKPKDRSEQMIANGYQTIRLLVEKSHQPMSAELIQEIQRSMTRDTLDDEADSGRFRTEADDVHVWDVRSNEVAFTPPPAQDLPARIERLVAFANAEPESEPFIHPLIRASILHFWLAYEHPFVDGNGRTARALFYWAMLKSGYWLFEFLTISRIIHAAPMQYYRSFLDAESDENDLTYFLMFQLDVTRRAVADLHKRLKEIADEQARMATIRRITYGFNPRQRALLDHALRHPNQVYTFESHQGSHGISYQTARTDLLKLMGHGFLVQSVSGRQLQYLPAPDLTRKLGLRISPRSR
jgi:Fic family protein